jgi:hypothetical protein
MMRRAWWVLAAVCAAFGCGNDRVGGDDDDAADGDADADADADGDADADADADADGDADGDADADGDGDADADADALLRSLAGEWHGSIGDGYAGGCLCLTLDEAGGVIEPSGITLGFDVTGGSTTIVDLAGRGIDILTVVQGSNFHIQDATVDEEGTAIDGMWVGESFHDFDDTIVLDRDPETCLERTGLDGAPC